MLNLYKAIKKFIRSKRHRLSRHLFAESILKKRGLEYRANEIEILGIGSSHCTRGFDTDMLDKAFNLGVVDQDLYTTHWIFDQYLDKLPQLKKVVAFYSIHSQGHELCKTQSFKNTAVSHYVFGVPYHVNWLKQWEKAAKHRFKKFDDSHIDYKSFSGYIPEKKNLNVIPMGPEARCAHHLRENKRFVKQNHHLYEMAEECQERGIQFFVVIAPARSDFLKELDRQKANENDLFHDLYKWAKEKKIPVLNELKGKGYEWDDFSDTDHLDISGAKKLTQKIAKFIDEPLK